MTGAEWMEMSQLAGSNSFACYAIFLTIVSAYIAAAYLVGKALSRAQLVLINTFFLFSASVCIFLLLATAQKHILAFNQAAMIIEELQPYSEVASITGLLLLFMGNTAFMLAATKFMWDVRHPKT